MLIVVDATAKSLLSARRLARLALSDPPPRAIVALANRVREPADVDVVRERTGLEVVAAVPYDEALADAERQGKAPIDVAEQSPAVAAVESLVDRLRREQYA